ncbi:WD40 repeat domain-containing serine/threonine protein kinase [Herbidospora galbida]
MSPATMPEVRRMEFSVGQDMAIPVCLDHYHFGTVKHYYTSRRVDRLYRGSTVVPQTSPLRPGDPTELGVYRIDARLGEGAQGVVYAGTAPDGTPVAIKLLRVSDAIDADSFLREVSAARRVAQFCTAQVLGAHMDGDRPYIVSELVDGVSLQRVVQQEGPRTGGNLHRLAVGTITALAAIHRAGIVHRDFKPSNVLLAQDGPRVIDFGIARALDSSSTLSSGVVGTPAYMSPEQIEAKRVGPPSDMFSWAVTMFYASTGRPAFGHDSLPAVLYRVMNDTPDVSTLPDLLRPIVEASLDKQAENRPTASEALFALLDHQVDDDLDKSLLAGLNAASKKKDTPPPADPGTPPPPATPGFAPPDPQAPHLRPPVQSFPPPGYQAQPGQSFPPPGYRAQPGQSFPPPGYRAQPGQSFPPPGYQAQPGQSFPPPGYPQSPPQPGPAQGYPPPYQQQPGQSFPPPGHPQGPPQRGPAQGYPPPYQPSPGYQAPNGGNPAPPAEPKPKPKGKAKQKAQETPPPLDADATTFHPRPDPTGGWLGEAPPTKSRAGLVTGVLVGVLAVAATALFLVPNLFGGGGDEPGKIPAAAQGGITGAPVTQLPATTPSAAGVPSPAAASLSPTTAPSPSPSPTPTGAPVPVLGKQDGSSMSGNRSSIYSVAVGGDKDHPVVVTAGVDRSVRMWNAESHKALGKPIYAHGDWVYAVATAEVNGRPLAVTGSRDGSVRVWDVEKRKAVGGGLWGHGNAVYTVAIGKVGSKWVAASGGADGRIRLWDLKTRQPIGGGIRAHKDVINWLSFGQVGDKTVIVSASEDKSLKVWDASSRKQYGKTFKGHGKPVYSVTTGEVDGKAVAISGGEDEKVRIWDLKTGKQVGKSLTGHKDNVYSLAYREIGGHPMAVSGSTDGTLRMWDLEKSEEVGKPVKAHDGKNVYSVGFADVDGKTVVVSAGEDKRVRFWKLAD